MTLRVRLIPCLDVKDGRVVKGVQFVGARSIIGLGLLNWIARVHQVDELHALDHPPIFDVETGDQPDAQGHAATPKASAGSMAPL